MFLVTTQLIQVVSLIISALALGVAAWFYTWVKAQPQSNKTIAQIGEYIRQGPIPFKT